MSSLVSICMPHLNSRAFIAERLESIFQQTLADWELVIVDSGSDDGSREILEDHARRDGRIRLFQCPRDGIYPNLNRGLERCTGRYVYIATSDDTMARDCLERLVAALERRPDCDLAHCTLRVMAEPGVGKTGWWSSQSTFARSSGDLLHRPHVRRAPLDGALHLLGCSVYISLTQLLVRRSLFARVGMFESRWGSVGDFNWEMRASFVANTIHVPDTWGGWRIHSRQATASARLDSQDHAEKAEDMIAEALQSSAPHLPPSIVRELRARWEPKARDLRRFLRGLRDRNGLWARRAFIAGRLLTGSWAARRHLASYLRGKKSAQETEPMCIRRWVETITDASSLLPLDVERVCRESANATQPSRATSRRGAGC